MFLHARSLRFAHPASGETIELQAALPPECLGLLQQLARLERQPTPKVPLT
jgi:23S rRNA pseudouridine955/2504/2580 synthase